MKIIWSHYGPQIDTNFRVASGMEGMKFGFEKEPSLLYSKNNNQLPFGCHAWEKYEPDFWEKLMD